MIAWIPSHVDMEALSRTGLWRPERGRRAYDFLSRLHFQEGLRKGRMIRRSFDLNLLSCLNLCRRVGANRHLLFPSYPPPFFFWEGEGGGGGGLWLGPSALRQCIANIKTLIKHCHYPFSHRNGHRAHELSFSRSRGISHPDPMNAVVLRSSPRLAA